MKPLGYTGHVTGRPGCGALVIGQQLLNHDSGHVTMVNQLI